MKLNSVVKMEKAKLHYVGDSHNILHNTDDNKHGVGFNSAIEELSKLEFDANKLAKLIGEYCNKNSLLYDGCRGLTKHIIQSMPQILVRKERS